MGLYGVSFLWKLYEQGLLKYVIYRGLFYQILIVTCVMTKVNVLKFQTLVACEIDIDKLRRSKSDCFCRSSLSEYSLFAILTSVL